MSGGSNIAILSVAATIHPDAIIEAARNAHLKRVLIVGWDENGNFFFSGSESIENTIYMLRNAEHELFRSMDIAESMT